MGQTTLPAARCPVSGRGPAYRPYDHDGMYDFFAEARRDEPVFFSPEIGYWVVTRREDVIRVLQNPDHYSASVALEPVNPLPQDVLHFLRDAEFTVEPVQSNSDRPKHTRIRDVAGRFLNAKRYLSFEPEIRALARGYIENMQGKGRVDLVESLTYEFPARVVFLLLGLRDVDPL